MPKYRITFYRPYLTNGEQYEPQHGELIADSEAHVRAIYSECDVTSIKLVEEPATVTDATALVYGAHELTPSQQELDDMAADWQSQVTELRGGL